MSLCSYLEVKCLSSFKVVHNSDQIIKELVDQPLVFDERFRQVKEQPFLTGCMEELNTTA